MTETSPTTTLAKNPFRAFAPAILLATYDQ